MYVIGPIWSQPHDTPTRVLGWEQQSQQRAQSFTKPLKDSAMLYVSRIFENIRAFPRLKDWFST